MSVTQPEAGAQVHTNDEEEENEPDLLENDSDDDEPKPKKAKMSLNYGAKTTPASRARQYPPGTFEPHGESMWCVACQKPVDYKRKSVADAHLKIPAHKAKAKCKKKVGSKWRNAETKSTILLHSIRIYRYGAPGEQRCPQNHITSFNVTFGAHCVVHCCVLCCLVIAFLWLHFFSLFCTYLHFFAFFCTAFFG